MGTTLRHELLLFFFQLKIIIKTKPPQIELCSKIFINTLQFIQHTTFKKCMKMNEN